MQYSRLSVVGAALKPSRVCTVFPRDYFSPLGFSLAVIMFLDWRRRLAIIGSATVYTILTSISCFCQSFLFQLTYQDKSRREYISEHTCTILYTCIPYNDASASSVNIFLNPKYEDLAESKLKDV